MTKTLIAAALAVTFASQAFASESFLAPNVPTFAAKVYQPETATRAHKATDAYAYQPRRRAS